VILPARWDKRLRRWPRRLRERVGVPGLIGLALLGAGAALAAYAPRVTGEAEALHAAAERARSRLGEVQRQAVRQPAPAQQAAELRAWFPPVQRATADLRVLFDTARKNRIELAHGEYALVPAADASRLQRYEIVLPVRQRYVTIKGFVAELLNAVPHASLAELRIERSAANVEQLDARVHLTLFYREP
jgi:hypothetical protein